jgi:hypothetical protein
MCSSIQRLGRRGRLPPGGVPQASARDQATDCRIRPAFASGRAVRRDGVGPAAGGRDNRAPGSLRNLVRVLLTELAHPISPLLWKKSLSQTQSKNQQALFSWQHMLHVMRLKSGRASSKSSLRTPRDGSSRRSDMSGVGAQADIAQTSWMCSVRPPKRASHWATLMDAGRQSGQNCSDFLLRLRKPASEWLTNASMERFIRPQIVQAWVSSPRAFWLTNQIDRK